MNKRQFCALAVGASALLLSSSFAQAPYPTKPITVIVPFAPGGNLDLVTRLIAASMGKTLGQSIIVDNKAGAGGLVGHQAGAKAIADGYTVTTTANGSFAITPKLQARPPFKGDDFIPVGSIASTPLLLTVNAAGRFRSINELLTFARTNPQQVTIGHSGNGTTNHVAILLLQEAAKVKFNIIPYKGSAPAITDLLSGQVDAIVDQATSSMPHIQSGRFKAIAVTTHERFPDLSNVPTIAESGVKGFDMSTTTGLLVPAKTPENVVNALNKALNSALSEPDVQKRLRELGSIPRPSTPAQFQAYLKNEEIKAEGLIKSGLLKDE